MTADATPSALEIFLSSRYVTCLEILRVDSLPTASFSTAPLREGFLGVDESDQARNLVVRAIERRHSFLRAATTNYRCDFLAIHIRGYQL